MVEFGITIPHFGRGAQPGVVEQVAGEAETLGFDAIWASDHVIVPAGEGYVPHHFYDPLIVMATAAALTERIRVGVSVLVIPYRDPINTAKMLATLDQISRGRIILGTGVGWLEAEFAALGRDFHARGRLTDEFLDCMQALWTTDPTSFAGETYAFAEMRQNPKPVQDPFPVWVGGNGPTAIRRAAQRGTGWHPINLGLGMFTAGVEAYHAACRSAGTSPGPVCLRSMPGGRVSPSADRVPFTGDPEQVAHDIDQYAAAGMSQILFAPPVRDTDELLQEMRHLATHVRPKLQGA